MDRKIERLMQSIVRKDDKGVKETLKDALKDKVRERLVRELQDC